LFSRRCRWPASRRTGGRGVKRPRQRCACCSRIALCPWRRRQCATSWRAATLPSSPRIAPTPATRRPTPTAQPLATPISPRAIYAGAPAPGAHARGGFGGGRCAGRLSTRTRRGVRTRARPWCAGSAGSTPSTTAPSCSLVRRRPLPPCHHAAAAATAAAAADGISPGSAPRPPRAARTHRRTHRHICVVRTCGRGGRCVATWRGGGRRG
jgi:hypothetical protein